MNKLLITILCMVALMCLVASPVSAKSYNTVTVRTVSVPKIAHVPSYGVVITNTVEKWLASHPIVLE